MPRSSPQTLSALRARIEHSIEELNRGNPDEVLARYRDDVEVRVPVYRPGDPVGEPVMRGKAAFRDFLLRYLGAHQSYRLRDLHPEPGGMMLSLECENGDRMTVRIENDADGLGRRVTIFAT